MFTKMEASIFDQEIGMTSHEWELFGGQLLLTVPDAPTDLGGYVLQGWTGESTGQLSGQSPVDEILQDSIWLDNVDVMTSGQLPSSLLKKESYSPRERSLSSDESFLIYEHDDDVGDDLTSTYPTSLEAFAPPPKTYSQGLSPIGANPEDEIAASFGFLSEPSGIWDQGEVHQSDNFLTSPHLSKAPSYPSFDALYPSHDGFGLDVSQEVPCDTFDLDDPVSVCKILKLLGDDINLESPDFSSPVSPEEVDSVLSYDSFADVLHLSSDVSSSARSVPDTDASFSTVGVPLSLELEYLQSDLSPKADSIRSHSAVTSEPYSGGQKVDRRQKKKEQNKTAAHRYRIKKREEKGVVKTEVEVLEEKNAALKARADELTREIDYLRALLDEIKRQ